MIFEICSFFASFGCDIRRPLPRIGKIAIKSSVYPLGQLMKRETIGFQGQGIQICSQIPENIDIYTHGARYDRRPLCQNRKTGIKSLLYVLESNLKRLTIGF